MIASTAGASIRHNRPFRSFWLGQTVSQFGDRITELALPLIAVTLLAATPGQVSMVTAFVWLPYLLGLFVGAYVDRRVRKRRILVAADVARATVLLSVPVAYVVGRLGMAQVLIVALLTGAGSVLFSMAYPSFFVTLVPASAYVGANSTLSMSRAASFVAGPAVGGVLIQAVTAPVVVAVDAVSFVVSAVLIGRIPLPEPVPAPASTSNRIRDGLLLVLRHRVLRAALGCTTTINFFTILASALLVLYASRELGLPAAAIGVAFGVGASGALAGAAVAPRVSRLAGLGRTAILGAVLFPAPLALMALAGGPAWAKAGVLAGAEFVSGIGVMLMDVNLNALIIATTPDDARGRTAGAYSTVNYGIRPLGALAGGVLATALGLRPTLVVAGLGGVLAACWLLASPVRHIAEVGEATVPDQRLAREDAPI